MPSIQHLPELVNIFLYAGFYLISTWYKSTLFHV